MAYFFDGRTVVDAKTLYGPRVYSTDLFPALYRRDDPTGSVEIAARALKIKLITKGQVTLNGLYLLSPAGVALFEADTGLFDGDGLIPAFREDQAELDVLVALNEKELAASGIDQSRIDEHVSKLRASVRKVLPWALGDVGEKLREMLIGGLSSETSLISIELAKHGFDKAARMSLMTKIRDADMSASSNVRALINVEPQPVTRLLSAFVTASYHKIGASVVNCEIGTDLHPLSEYRAADMLLAAREIDGAAQLTEEAIFLDGFAATALAAIHGLVAADTIIDSINFKTAHDLGNALREQGFQKEYEETVAKVMALTRANGQLDLESLDVEDITEAVTRLHNQFTEAVTRELPKYLTENQRDAKHRLFKAGSDLLRDGAGQVPGASNLVATYDAVQHTKDLAAAGWDMLWLSDTQAALTDGAKKRQEKISEAINNFYVGRSGKSKLLDGMAVTTDLYIKAIQRV